MPGALARRRARPAGRNATAGRAFGTANDLLRSPQRQQTFRRKGDMKKVLLATTALLALAATPAAAQQKTIKIGFISTFTGPVAAIGNDMRNSFELGLDHHGRKLGGLPVEVIYEDDLVKPEVGVQKTQKLIESDKVDFVVGYIWSN